MTSVSIMCRYAVSHFFFILLCAMAPLQCIDCFSSSSSCLITWRRFEQNLDPRRSSKAWWQ